MIELYEYQKQYLATCGKDVIMHAALGTGKTFMSLAHYENHTKPAPLLVVCPASKVKDWERDIDLYFAGDTPEYKVYSIDKFCRTPKRSEKSPEPVWQQFMAGSKWAVIVDECSYIKNPQSLRGKVLFKISQASAQFIGLSGTPMPNGWIDFANYSKIWGFTRNITEFKKTYCTIQDYKGFPEIVGYQNKEELKQQWEQISRQLTREQASELPSRQFIYEKFKMSSEYRQMAKTRITKDGDELDSVPKLISALRQSTTKNKLPWLKDLFESTDENIVIFYNYNSERDEILAAAKKAKKTIFEQNGHAHTLPEKSEWDNITNSVTIAHYKSAAVGVEMTYAAITVYFSLTYSYQDFEQSIGRTHRNGQTKKCVYYILFTQDTIERNIIDCLKNKQDFTTELAKRYIDNL